MMEVRTSYRMVLNIIKEYNKKSLEIKSHVGESAYEKL